MSPTDNLPELYQQFENLPQVDQTKYLSLSYHEDPTRAATLKTKLLQRGFPPSSLSEMSQVASIMQTNAFNIDLRSGPEGPTHRALFSKIARINHSCTPNAHVCFYPPGSPSSGKGRMVVHTLRPLPPGSELQIAYFNILLPLAQRQTKAQKWGFTCNCPLCSAPQKVAEQQRRALREFTTAQHSKTSKEIAAAVKKGRALIASVEDIPELFPALPDVYEKLAALKAHSLVLQKRESRYSGEVIELYEQAALWSARITGPESPATADHLARLTAAAARASSETPRVVVDDWGEYTIEWSHT